jgi:hypothetical protein
VPFLLLTSDDGRFTSAVADFIPALVSSQLSVIGCQLMPEPD